MAARITQKHSAETRKKIQTSQLINRLNKNALADEEIMTTGQIRAAEILLRKALPDLTAVAFTDGEGNDLPASLSMEFKNVPEE